MNNLKNISFIFYFFLLFKINGKVKGVRTAYLCSKCSTGKVRTASQKMIWNMGSALPAEDWEKFVSGDISNFQKLFDGYYDGLYGYGLKICSDSGLVEDCIQELFEFIWVKRNDLDHINSPNVYLFVSLRRKIFTVLKKRDHFKDGNEIFEDLNIHFGMEEVIIKREFSLEKKKELHEALNQLTNQQKEVIYLYYYNGMSYSEIEDILSINRQSVHNHMYRGMESLRSVLNKDIMRLVISILACVMFFFN